MVELDMMTTNLRILIFLLDQLNHALRRQGSYLYYTAGESSEQQRKGNGAKANHDQYGIVK